MGIWDILGIDRTKDRTQIKKAYAKMLKVYHPEDDPEGFMKLRKAYEDALRQAEHIDHPVEIKKFEIQPVQEAKELIHGEASYDVDDEKGELLELTYVPDKKPFNTFSENNIDPMKDFASIYNDVFKRRDLRCWQSFFQELSLIKLENLCKRVFSFLNENGDIPHEVWRFLDEQLLLSNNKAFKWQELIKYDFGLSFDYFDESAECDFTEYSRLRFSSFISLRHGNYKASAETAKKAFMIYDKDPVLFKISGISSYMICEYDNAIEALSKAIFIKPLDAELLSYMGSAYFKKRDFERAQSDFEAASKIEPDNFNHKKEILKCIYAQKKYSKAEKYFRKMFVRNPQDLELDMIANNIYRSKLSNRIKANPAMDKLKHYGKYFGIAILAIIICILIISTPGMLSGGSRYIIYFVIAAFIYICRHIGKRG